MCSCISVLSFLFSSSAQALAAAIGITVDSETEVAKPSAVKAEVLSACQDSVTSNWDYEKTALDLSLIHI